jgi:hypothetical protein
LKSLSSLKTQKNEIEIISLTLPLQFDNFIARGQVQENKNLVFFPTALLERKNQTHKARVMQATQATTQPKLTLHMLSSFAHIRNYTLFYRLFNKIFFHSNKSIVNLKLEHENVSIRSLNNIRSVYCYSLTEISQIFKHIRIISKCSRQRRGLTFIYVWASREPQYEYSIVPYPFFC